MGGNVLAEFFKSQEDRKRVQQIEQLRRKGHNFIKVRYVGNIIPATDAEGVVYNLRLHGLRDVEAYERTNINDGKTSWESRPGARARAAKAHAGCDHRRNPYLPRCASHNGCSTPPVPHRPTRA